MDFYELDCIRKRDHDLYQPDFLVKRSEDLMIRGQVFYAIYNKYTGFWSTNIYDVATLIDKEIKETLLEKFNGEIPKGVAVSELKDYSSGCWNSFIKYTKFKSP